MAREDMITFREMLFSDADFQEKFRKAAEAYTGEKDPEAVFDNLLIPFAEEYGLSGTYEDFSGFMESIISEAEGELSEEELSQVAGGNGGGLGKGICYSVGVGIGGGGALKDDKLFGFGLCILVGAGAGEYSCVGSGEAIDVFE